MTSIGSSSKRPRRHIFLNSWSRCVYGDRWLLVGDHKQLPPFNFGKIRVSFDQVQRSLGRQLIDRGVPDLSAFLDGLSEDAESLVKGLFAHHKGTYWALIQALADEDRLIEDPDQFRAANPQFLLMEAIAELIEGTRQPERLYWPPQLHRDYQVGEPLHNMPIDFYHALHHLQGLYDERHSAKRLLDEQTGVVATTEMFHRAKSQLARKGYVKFQAFCDSPEFKNLFVGVLAEAKRLHAQITAVEEPSREALKSAFNDADRSKRYFQYAFDKINRGSEDSEGQQADRLGRKTIPVQYRMHPSIRHVVSRLFYEDTPGARIRDPFEGDTGLHNAWLATKEHGLGGDLKDIHVAWVNVEGEQERVPRGTTSFNWKEAEWIVQHFLPELRRALDGNGALKSTRVVILSGYRGQVRLFQEGLPLPTDRDGNMFANELGRLRQERLRVTEETVDSFQGQDADIVIVSMVAASRCHFWRDTERDINYDEDREWTLLPERATEARNRLNVMLSRARKLLIVVGHKTLLRDTCMNVEKLLELLESDASVEPQRRHYTVLDGARAIRLGEHSL